MGEGASTPHPLYKVNQDIAAFALVVVIVMTRLLWISRVTLLGGIARKAFASVQREDNFTASHQPLARRAKDGFTHQVVFPFR